MIPAACVRRPTRQTGFSMVELMVGAVLGTLLLGGVYRLWSNSQAESHRLQKKIELRNQMTLSSKKIQRSITLAGLGFKSAPKLLKTDAPGSDTLMIYTNLPEASTVLAMDVAGDLGVALVANATIFQYTSFVAVTDSLGGEVRRILRREGPKLILVSTLSRGYSRTSSKIYPVRQEKFYTDQSTNQLVSVVDDRASIMGNAIRNFQVSFRNRLGEPTEIATEIRSVTYSFSGMYPAKDKALNSVIFSSTAIPRNIL